MSLKIYQGFKYNGNWESLISDLMFIRESLYNDETIELNSKESFFPQFSIVSIKGGIYLMLLGIRQDMIQPYLNNKFVEYSYWDNDDKPDDINENERDERGNVRSELIDYLDFNKQGFVFYLFESERYQRQITRNRQFLIESEINKLENTIKEVKKTFSQESKIKIQDRLHNLISILVN